MAQLSHVAWASRGMAPPTSSAIHFSYKGGSGSLLVGGTISMIQLFRAFFFGRLFLLRRSFLSSSFLLLVKILGGASLSLRIFFLFLHSLAEDSTARLDEHTGAQHDQRAALQ